MLSGFNTNFRYRGVLFHVQTEDSGLENPHVITHLFHGGNIMASEKRDYSDLKAEKSGVELENAIRKVMEGLHKSMLKQLSRGAHDAAIEQRMGPEVFRVEPASPRPEPSGVTEQEAPPKQPSPNTPTVSPEVLLGRTSAEVTRIESELPKVERTQRTSSGLSRVFGERVVSEKPLDEVVLDYLVENARKRKRSK